MSKHNAPTFSKNDFEVTQSDLLYKGVFQLKRYHLKHRLFNGQWSAVFSREIFERPSAAAILPYDPVHDRVVLIEQFRAGAIDQANPWILEVVAGVYGQNETPEAVARRESAEEAGCEIKAIEPVCDFFVSPGGSNEHLHLYVGHIDITQRQDGIYGLIEENEDIRAFSIPRSDAFKMIQSGKIKTSPAIIALQWLELNQEWLKQKWQTK